MASNSAGETPQHNLGMELQIRNKADEYGFSIDVAEQVRRLVEDAKIPCEIRVKIEVTEIE